MQKKDTFQLDLVNNYLVNNSDTIKQIAGRYFITPDKKGKQRTFYDKKIKCDSLINQIRSGSYLTKLKFAIDDTALHLIGIDNNEEFYKYLKKDKFYNPINTQFFCFDNYKAIFDSVQLDRFKTVHLILDYKLRRMDNIKNNVGVIDSLYIKDFIKTYDICDVDTKAFCYLITNHCDDFLITCKDNYDFTKILFGVERIPAEIDKPKLIQKLNSSLIKSTCKDKLLKKIK